MGMKSNVFYSFCTFKNVAFLMFVVVACGFSATETFASRQFQDEKKMKQPNVTSLQTYNPEDVSEDAKVLVVSYSEAQVKEKYIKFDQGFNLAFAIWNKLLPHKQPNDLLPYLNPADRDYLTSSQVSIIKIDEIYLSPQHGPNLKGLKAKESVRIELGGLIRVRVYLSKAMAIPLARDIVNPETGEISGSELTNKYHLLSQPGNSSHFDIFVRFEVGG